MQSAITREKYLNYIAYAGALLAGFAIVMWYYAAGDSELKVLLWLHAAITSAVYGIPMQYINGIGYSAMNGSFAIGRECLGLNFVVLQFCMLSCMFARKFPGWKKALWALAALGASAVVGLAVSCIRILASIPFAYHEKFATIHSAIGIMLYFITLLSSYFLTRKLLGGMIRNENI